MQLPSILTIQTIPHMATWIILIFLSYFLLAMKKGSKERKIAHLIVRILYVFVIFTGCALLTYMIHTDLAPLYILKALLGFAYLVIIECTIVRANKGKTFALFIYTGFVLILILSFLGYYLPLGMGANGRFMSGR